MRDLANTQPKNYADGKEGSWSEEANDFDSMSKRVTKVDPSRFAECSPLTICNSNEI